MSNQYLITANTIIEYEEWFNDYKEYLWKVENCNLSINDDKISSFRGVPIKGQNYHMATAGYNVGLSSPDFDGLYNYLKYRMVKSDEGKI